MNDLVTVVIPAYNHEDFVVEAIQSIIVQTHSNIELIIINDGSTDGTHAAICSIDDLCRKRFNKYQYINQENEGLVKTLNKAIDLACSDFIYLIASDDIAKSHAIAKLYKFISQNDDYGLVVGDNEIIDGNSDIVFWDKKRDTLKDKKRAKYLTFVDFLRESVPEINFLSDEFGSYDSLLQGNYIPNGYIMRREAIVKEGKYKDCTLDDWCMNLQISRNYKMKFIDEILFSYRWHQTNTMKSKDLSFLALGTLINEHDYWLGCPNSDKYNVILIEKIVGSINKIMKSGDELKVQLLSNLLVSVSPRVLVSIITEYSKRFRIVKKNPFGRCLMKVLNFK